MERQAVALAASIRRFSGCYAASSITAVSPCRDRRPGQKTQTALKRLGADYLEFDLESPVPEYRPSFKVLVLAEIARRCGPDILIQIDSDTVFCAEPELELENYAAAARPVDVEGMCSTGPGDPLEVVWDRLAGAAGISLAGFPTVEATVTNRRVRASYNGGLLVAQRRSGIYQLTEQLFTKFVAADIRPFGGRGLTIRAGAGLVTGKGAEFWGLTQVAFSMAATKLGKPVKVLDPNHNIPLHMLLPARESPRHLHYHDVFGTPDAATLQAACKAIETCSLDFRRWLDDQLPL